MLEDGDGPGGKVLLQKTHPCSQAIEMAHTRRGKKYGGLEKMGWLHNSCTEALSFAPMTATTMDTSKAPTKHEDYPWTWIYLFLSAAVCTGKQFCGCSFPPRWFVESPTSLDSGVYPASRRSPNPTTRSEKTLCAPLDATGTAHTCH